MIPGSQDIEEICSATKRDAPNRASGPVNLSNYVLYSDDPSVDRRRSTAVTVKTFITHYLVAFAAPSGPLHINWNTLANA